MSDEEVGQYIRLMCIQANKGFITKKDMLHICKSYDNDVCLKFTDIGQDRFANSILTEILEQRKSYAESRRNNRKGKKQEHMNNISNTYVSHMVNVNVDVNIEDKIKSAFDEIYLNQQKMHWSYIDFESEFKSFLLKIRGSPEKYISHDTGGLRLALQAQLRNAKQPKKATEQKNRYKIQ